MPRRLCAASRSRGAGACATAATSSPSAVTISGIVSTLMSFIFMPSDLMSCSRPRLGRAQLLADAQLLFLEALDACAWLRESRIASLPPGCAVCSLVSCSSVCCSCCFELLLLGAELRVGVAAQLLDALERPRIGGAAANADEVVAAAEIVERVPDQLAVVGERLRDHLAEEVALLHPHEVGQQVGIGDHDDVERLGRRLQRIGRGRDARAAGRRGTR